MAPGANIGDGFGVFEATHGTAPKYADKDMINPGAVIRSGALMFEFMGWPEVGKLIEDALAATIVQHRVTYDLERLMQMEGIKDVQTLGTSGFASAIIENMTRCQVSGVSVRSSDDRRQVPALEASDLLAYGPGIIIAWHRILPLDT